MTMIELGTLLVALTAIVGSTYSIYRNGRSRSEKLTEFKTEIKAELSGVTKALNDGEYGLMALNQKVSNFQVHCAQVSTSLQERVIALESTTNKCKPKKRKT